MQLTPIPENCPQSTAVFVELVKRTRTEEEPDRRICKWISVSSKEDFRKQTEKSMMLLKIDSIERINQRNSLARSHEVVIKYSEQCGYDGCRAKIRKIGQMGSTGLQPVQPIVPFPEQYPPHPHCKFDK